MELEKIKKDYLQAKKDIYNDKCNKGEKDERLCQLDLLYFNKTKQYDKLVNIFGEEASEGIKIINMNTELPYTNFNEIQKTKSCFKADSKIIMNMNNYTYSPSIKSKTCARPTIINHTARTAKVFQEQGKLYKHKNSLDQILEEYINKRNNNIIGEDASVLKLYILQNNLIKEDFKEIISYFLFDGTGKGDNAYPADSIIYYYGENDIKFIKCINNIEKKNI